MNKHEHQAKNKRIIFLEKKGKYLLDISVKILVKVSLEYQHQQLLIELFHRVTNLI